MGCCGSLDKESVERWGPALGTDFCSSLAVYMGFSMFFALCSSRLREVAGLPARFAVPRLVKLT